jgi:hypothetical protein
MSRPDILDIQPGYLNDFNVDDVDQESIDFQSETPQSILTRVKDKVFSPNKFKTSGTLIGILLRKESVFDGDCTSQDVVIAGQTGAGKKYALDTYKVRVPELHFMLPVPTNLPVQKGSATYTQDRLIVDSYPTIQAMDTHVQKLGARVGDLVKVELANKGAITRMYYAGPLNPLDPVSSKAKLQECFDSCEKTYTGKGSAGDCAGKAKNIADLDEVPPLTTEQGIQEKKAIAIQSPEWLRQILDPNNDKNGNANFDGITIFGRFGSEGTDNVSMIDASPGRSTVIFIPKGVDPKKSIELVYFFHDKGKFSKEPDEWNTIGKTIFNMTRKNSKFGGARRNLIFVMPEMLWSKQSTTGDNPRVTTKTNSTIKNSYGDRQWVQWGFDGKLKKFGDTKHLSYVQPTKTVEGAGNIDTLIKAVYKQIKDATGTDIKNNVKFITLAAEKYGGVAISNLARMDKLKDFGNQLQKIQLFHADFAADENLFYLNSDIRDIVTAINPNQTEIEFHLSSQSAAPDKPKKAVAAFIGNTSRLLIKWSSEGSIPEGPDAVNKLIEEQKTDLYAVGQSNPKANQGLKTKYETNSYDKGLQFINASSAKTMRLSGPWINFIFRGVSGPVTFDWITWYPENGKDLPTAAASSVVGPAPEDLVVVPDSSDIKDADKKSFAGFKGKVLLYQSQHSGLKGKTAIVVPLGADVKKPYELIYFFHGLRSGGTSPDNWRDHGFGNKHNQNISEKLFAMVNSTPPRNIVYVTTQLNVQGKMDYKKATFGANSGKSFKSFHEEVVAKIKEKDPTKGIGIENAVDPKFINIKSFSGGYYSLKGLVEQMASSKIGNTPLQRIDYLDSTYRYKSVFKKLLVDFNTQTQPGVNFEIHVYSSTEEYKKTKADGNEKVFPGTWQLVKKHKAPAGTCKNGFNGCAEIANSELSKLDGLYLEGPSTLGKNHWGPLQKRFAAKSKLKNDVAYTSDFVPLKGVGANNKVNAKEIPVSYDKDGNAFNADGTELDEKYKLKDTDVQCGTKGNTKGQRPNTQKPAEYEKCMQECRKRFTGKSANKAAVTIEPGIPACGDNPLGLIHLGENSELNKKWKYTDRYYWKKRPGPKDNPDLRQYSWGTLQLAQWIDQVLENPIWGLTADPPNGGKYYSRGPKKKIQWILADMSPQWANDIDKVTNHGSHRGGRDLDMVFPIDYARSKPGTILKPRMVNHRDHKGTPYKSGRMPALDYDKTIVLGILTVMFFPGTRCYVGNTYSDFKPGMIERCKEISAVITGTLEKNKLKYGPWDPAYQALFARHFGAADRAKAMIKKLFNKHSGLYGSEPNHNHHFHWRIGTRKNTKIKQAIANLKKKSNCTWKEPHKYSTYTWKKYARQYSSQGKYPPTKRPGKKKK